MQESKSTTPETELLAKHNRRSQQTIEQLISSAPPKLETRGIITKDALFKVINFVIFWNMAMANNYKDGKHNDIDTYYTYFKLQAVFQLELIM